MLHYDYVVIGSGFGGSVAALRLAEKGYSVAVVEMGRRWRTEDFPETNMRLRRYLWYPRLGLRGYFNLHVLPHVMLARGIGVGGGSLVYANTLYNAPDAVWSDPAWANLADWREEMPGWYAVARRMLGAVRCPTIAPEEETLREYGASIGREEGFHAVDVGVYFGEAGKTVPDPYFDGRGPERTGCTLCGGCMVGCRVGAKNTLDKNYLFLAEKLGARIYPETRVTSITALDGAEGATGYRIHTEASIGRRPEPYIFTARGVVLAAGVIGTLDLLTRCKERGTLPRLSRRLGDRVRTNSEGMAAVSRPGPKADVTRGLAIMASLRLDETSAVEVVRYPAGSDFIATQATVYTPGGGTPPRPFRWLLAILLHPMEFLASLWPFGWAKRTVLVFIMQAIDDRLRLRRGRRWYWPFRRTLISERPADQPASPVHIPRLYEVARFFAGRWGGRAQSPIAEVVLGKSVTAHILGGCTMGADAEQGVIDHRHRVHGYKNLYVVDGSAISANLGVNPSLTITALAERAMSHIPDRVPS